MTAPVALRSCILLHARRIADRLDLALAEDHDGRLSDALAPATDMIGGFFPDGLRADLDETLDEIRDDILAMVRPARGWGRPGDLNAPQPSAWTQDHITAQQQSFAYRFVDEAFVRLQAASIAAARAVLAVETCGRSA